MASCELLSVTMPRSRRIRASMGSALLRKASYSSSRDAAAGCARSRRRPLAGALGRARIAYAHAIMPDGTASRDERGRRSPTTSGCRTSSASWSERGSLGVLVLDASPLAAIEDEYGTRRLRGGAAAGLQAPRRAAGQGLPARGHPLPRPAAGPALPVLPRPQAAAQRRPSRSPTCAPCAAGSLASLVPNLARAAFPYIKTAAPHRGGLRPRHPQPPPAPRADRSQRAVEEALSTRPPTRRRADEIAGAGAAAGHPPPRARGDRLPAHPAHEGGHDHGLRGPLAGAPGLGPRGGRRPLRGRHRRTTCSSSSTASAGSGPCSPRAASPRTRRSS